MRMYLVAVLAIAGCMGNDPPPTCVDLARYDACKPLYVPTFDNVYANTLMNTCGSQRVSCHSHDGMKGGMTFEDPDAAHASLLAGRLMPGNPACSKMIVRTSSAGAHDQMPPPPAEPLGDTEVCALIQWIDNP